MRPSWDDYFLAITKVVATRADCRRSMHGAVIVKNNRIVSTGYNGAPAGDPLSCLAGDCPRGFLSKDEVPSMSDYDSGPGVCISVHAEQNAICYGNRHDMEDATIYVTGQPCPTCTKLIKAAGITRVVYP